jgi:hypothetical protein
MIPKPDAEKIWLPAVPSVAIEQVAGQDTRAHNLYKTRLYYASTDVIPAPNLSESVRYPKNQFNYLYFRHVFHRQGTGAARTKPERMMDKYWYVPVPTDRFTSIEHMDGEHNNVIPPKTRIIYPASIFKHEIKEAEGGITEHICRACEKPFPAKRSDAQFCGTACRKWWNRYKTVVTVVKVEDSKQST